VKVIAINPILYKGVQYKSGDMFETDEIQAQTWVDNAVAKYLVEESGEKAEETESERPGRAGRK